MIMQGFGAIKRYESTCARLTTQQRHNNNNNMNRVKKFVSLMEGTIPRKIQWQLSLLSCLQTMSAETTCLNGAVKSSKGEERRKKKQHRKEDDGQDFIREGYAAKLCHITL